MSRDDEETAEKPKKFRPRPRAVRMPPDQARRQGAIASYAFVQFGDRDEAMSFLNTHNTELDARPIDIATSSDAGLARVNELIDTARP